MFSTRSWLAISFFLLPSLALAVPIIDSDATVVQSESSRRPQALELPITRRKVQRTSMRERDTVYSGSIGVGDLQDLFYTVTLGIGNTTTTVNLDTGSSDLWVISNACEDELCLGSAATPYDVSSGEATSTDVLLAYGDSTTATHASGPVFFDTVAVAGLAMENQLFAAVNTTDNSVVKYGAAGIFGLGFPTQSFVEAAYVSDAYDSESDDLVSTIGSYGPLISRMAMSGLLEQPLFSISLQRDTIDLSGHGRLTVGRLPKNVTNSSLTWVPVRLYGSNEGGTPAPSFAPNEMYPLRWEIPLEGVFLDGIRLPDTNLTGASQQLSALIDTGNSIIRGPQDVMKSIFTSVSPAYAANPQPATDPTYPCATPHTLSFQIAGKQFPIDPRDFIVQKNVGDATTCVADNLASTDAPSNGTLFSWSLGDPFLKSNLVVFYYGNLTHPSVDPPRIGFLSRVPQNASEALRAAVRQAVSSGGEFESTSHVAPTATMLLTVPAPSETDAIPDGVAPPTNAVNDNVASSSVTPAPSRSPVRSSGVTFYPNVFRTLSLVVVVHLVSYVFSF